MPLGELIRERDSATAGTAHRTVTGDRHTAEPSALLTTRLSDRGEMAGRHLSHHTTPNPKTPTVIMVNPSGTVLFFPRWRRSWNCYR